MRPCWMGEVERLLWPIVRQSSLYICRCASVCGGGRAHVCVCVCEHEYRNGARTLRANYYISGSALELGVECVKCGEPKMCRLCSTHKYKNKNKSTQR